LFSASGTSVTTATASSSSSFSETKKWNSTDLKDLFGSEKDGRPSQRHEFGLSLGRVVKECLSSSAVPPDALEVEEVKQTLVRRDLSLSTASHEIEKEAERGRTEQQQQQQQQPKEPLSTGKQISATSSSLNEPTKAVKEEKESPRPKLVSRKSTKETTPREQQPQELPDERAKDEDISLKDLSPAATQFLKSLPSFSFILSQS
jgi:hypothetical protein